jgi:lactaldehyde dehydrogenase / glycolaldehyde dehydrogenase
MFISISCYFSCYSVLSLRLSGTVRGNEKKEEQPLKNYQMYINGEFTESSSGEKVNVINPSTEEVISTVPKGTEEDAVSAIEAAYEAQKEWEKVPAFKRGEYLFQIADKLEARKEEFAKMLSEEQGKTLYYSRDEIRLTVEYFRYMAGWARKYEGEIITSDRPNENILMFKRPIGVVTGIIPWNFPLFILARRVAPALVTGCTTVIKPSTETPNTSAEFAKIIHEVGLPKGVFNLVLGSGSTVGNILASHEKVGMVSVTGSVETGVKVMESASKNLVKVNLELGGKAPAIVSKNANLDLAVKKIKQSRIDVSGQVCTCAERVYVHESVAEAFIEKMVEAIKGTTYGNPLGTKEDVEMGPLISEEQVKKVDGMVLRAVEAGARVLTGGKPAETEKGYFYEPTVLVDVKQDMEIIQKEVFGPVLPIMTYSTFDEAIELANDCEYGLSSSIYTENIHEAMRAANEIKFGETFVNRENFEALQGYHAGVRKSGIGGADGKHGLEECLVTHAVYMEYNADYNE